MNISNIIVLLGGVALFLFGMSLMGDGLKKVAGNKLELVLYKLSSTPLKGILLGTGVTAIIQSSSATSVMVVGFVNSGMMRVRQAIGVVMGAIIGTSATGWVICLSDIGGDEAGFLSLLSTETLSAIIAIIGIVIRMVSKKKSSKHVADILLGFAVLMFGMKTMSGAVSGLKDSETFISMLTGFRNPIVGILFGMVFTAILQSASATVGILQALAITGAITFDIALPIILGISIGASVPVLISAVGSTPDGKRTALSYMVVEVLRVIIFGTVFYSLNAVMHFEYMSAVMTSVSIAAFNTIYRIITVVVLIPFIGGIERIVTLMVREKQDDDLNTKDLSRLEERFLAYPALAVEQCRLSINGMADSTRKNFYEAISLQDEYSQEVFDKVEKLESLVDKYEDRLGNYLTKLTSHDLSDRQTKDVGKYLHTITDLERISDHSLNIAESYQEMHEKKIIFSENGRKELGILSRAVAEIVSMTVKGLEDNNMELAHRVEALEDVIDDLCDEIKINHIERLQNEECTLQNGYVINDLLTNYERIGDQCSNIALAMVVEEGEGSAPHEYTAEIEQSKPEEFENFVNEYREKFAL